MLPSGAAAKAAVQDFTAGAIYPVLVTSYETLRLVADQLAGHCDLLICDEGHRCVQRSGVAPQAVPRQQGGRSALERVSSCTFQRACG